jgi:uncharacterized protein (TIGR02266 family)
MPSSPNRQAKLQSRRIDLEREIAIRVPRFENFVTEYSANLSTTGMFIVSTKPLPPATTFHFEFSVADDWKLIRGTARVVWTRYKKEGAERPPGMGVKFLELDTESRRLVRWIVEKHLREGGKPFELDGLSTDVDTALEEVYEAGAMSDADPMQTSDRAQESGRTPQATGDASSPSRMVSLILTAGAILTAVCLLFWLSDRLPDGTTDDASTRAGESSAAAARKASDEPIPVPPEASPEERPSATPEPAAPSQGTAYSAATDAVTAWADAWSTRDVASYLTSYSRSFVSDSGLGMEEWAARRREQIVGSAYINVSISGLQAERLSEDRIRVTFNENYRSDRRNEMVRKTMEMVWENGAWKIVRETPS